MNVTVPYGASNEILAIPDCFSAIEVITPTDVHALPNLEEKIASALCSPTAGPPLHRLLQPGYRVAIVINDITRNTHSSLFLPYVIDCCRGAGVAEQDISVLVGNGAHRGHTTAELQSLVGDDTFARIKVFDHDCKDTGSLVYVGTTSFGNRVYLNRIAVESDRVILIGSIGYHYCAGYSGGRKSVLPGIAGFGTIEFNHRLMLDQKARPGNMSDNPMNTDMLEAVRLLHPAFILNEVVGGSGEIVALVSGEYVKSHLIGCDIVDRLFSVNLRQQSDLVVASCGGHPKDINLYQSHKALENAVVACRPNGAVILLAECSDGFGSRALEEEAKKWPTLPTLEAKIGSNFQLGLHKAYRIVKLTQKQRTYLVSALESSAVAGLGFVGAATFAEALSDSMLRIRPDRLLIMPYASSTLPRL